MEAKVTPESLLEEGLRSLEAGNYAGASTKLEEALALGAEPQPFIDAARAVCLAALRQQYTQAIETCKQAIAQEPCSSALYLHLGRVYLLADKRKEAIACFREGMLYRRDQRIMNELKQLGLRRRPVFDSLPRQHFLNRVAGRLCARFRH